MQIVSMQIPGVRAEGQLSLKSIFVGDGKEDTI